MTAINIPRNAAVALEVAQSIRNGKAPTADIQNQLSTLVGYAASVTTLPVFRSVGQLCSGGSSLVLDSLATRPRWRFAFHTGPYAWYLLTRFVIAPQNNGTPTDPYCELRIYNTSGTEVGRATMHGGSSNGTASDVPSNMAGGAALVVNPSDPLTLASLTADTEYTGVFWDIGYARLQSASCWQVSLNPDTDNGYATNNIGTGGPIYSSHRNDVAAMARLLHKRSGTPVFHWCSNVDSAAPSQASGSSTAAAAMTLDALTVSSTGTVGGTGTVDVTLGALTISSTGTLSQSFDVTTGTSVGTIVHGNSLTLTAYVAAVGVPQTTGAFRIQVGHSAEAGVDIPVDIGLDGWTNGGWSEVTPGSGVWYADFSLTTVSSTSYALTFTVTPTKVGTLNCQTNVSPLPSTDQASGSGSISSVTVT